MAGHLYLFRLALVCLLAARGAAQSTPAVINGPMPAPLPIMPQKNWWNTEVTHAPKDPKSAQIIAFINNGGNRAMHPDWGAAPYGIPYCTVAGDQPLVPVTFQYNSESDKGAPGRPLGYPIPELAKTQAGWIEGFTAGGGTGGDRHMLIVDTGHRTLFELYGLHWSAQHNRWEAGSGAIWPLDTNKRRTNGWTSADAAGLAILPGLVRYDEVYGAAPIKHAFRFTVRDSPDYYVFPASHVAGDNAAAPPFGTRLRLKANVDITKFEVHARRIFQAMKTYGLILADNGSDMYVTGTYDPRWDMDIFVPAFGGLHANDFEVVKLGWQPALGAENWNNYQ